jgi:MFS family permease
MGLALSGFSATAYLQAGSILGVLAGGALADRFARRHVTGRMRAQAIGLIAGVPFLFVMGWTRSVPVVVMAMAGFGFFKGVYDSNIWAALHDWVNPRRRAEAVGFMNSVGWFSSSLGTMAVGASAARFGLRAAISACSLVYLAVGVTMLGGIIANRRSGTARSAEKPA